MQHLCIPTYTLAQIHVVSLLPSCTKLAPPNGKIVIDGDCLSWMTICHVLQVKFQAASAKPDFRSLRC